MAILKSLGPSHPQILIDQTSGRGSPVCGEHLGTQSVDGIIYLLSAFQRKRKIVRQVFFLNKELAGMSQTLRVEVNLSQIFEAHK